MNLKISYRKKFEKEIERQRKRGKDLTPDCVLISISGRFQGSDLCLHAEAQLFRASRGVQVQRRILKTS